MTTTNKPSFVMVQLTDIDRLMELFASRELMHRDASVIFALISGTDTYSGKVRLTANALANQLQITPNEARAAIARLKKQHLVRHIKDPKTGEAYYRLNPWMVRSTGSVALQTLAMREFEEA